MAEPFVPSGSWCARLEFVNGLESITTEYAYTGEPCPSGWWLLLPKDQADALTSAYLAALNGGNTPQFSTAEVAALKYQAANPSPFNLSISDGAYVGGAIVATWAVAWGLRALVQVLGVADGNQQE